MNAIILAGGKSSRFGKDKAFIKVKGTAIFKRQLNVLTKIFDETIVVTDNPQKFHLFGSYIRKINERNLRAGYKLKKIEIVQYILPAKGPLCGILSGLIKSRSRHNFVIACDMPFINEGLIKYMIKNIKKFDIFIPKIDNKFHPLCGVYSKNCISVIGWLLLQDRLKVSDLFSKKIAFGDKTLSLKGIRRSILLDNFKMRFSVVGISAFEIPYHRLKVKFISKKKLQSFDKDLLCLENINTLQDLKNVSHRRIFPDGSS